MASFVARKPPTTTSDISTPAAVAPRTALPGLNAALDRGISHMLSLQAAGGYWWGELEANVTMASEHLLLEQFLGIGDPTRWRKLSTYILRRQNGDGSWPIYFGGPGDLSVTIEAYFALKVGGADANSEPMRKARNFVLAHGGIGRARVFTRLWLALFGQSDWEALPAMPPEAMLLPARSPLNIYEFSSWARATIVPILVVWACRPVSPLPDGMSVDELYVHPADRRSIPFANDGWRVGWANTFLGIDRILQLFERLPHKPLREKALTACERWIVDHQEADGSWGGIQPPWVYSLIALKCLGYANDHPVMARGIAGLLSGFALETEDEFTIQPCISPVWDTALAITGLREAGLPANHPSLLRAGRWLLQMEVQAGGDWCVKVQGQPPGGWPFEFANDKYPDTDDTAEVLIALRLLDLHGEDAPASQRALRWLRAMQSKNGGWGAFDCDNTRQFVTKIPFADFGATLDPPTEDVTAHIVECFALFGVGRSDNAQAAARRYLLTTQQSDGSWWGRWGSNYIYGLGAALPALAASGSDPRGPRFRRAVRWLEEHQNPDGGWGESCRSYEDPTLRGRGPSTASQTAWALLALLAACEERSSAVERGVRYLIGSQSPNGEWLEDEFTGTGFPRDFMLKYHLYRNYWPLWALGRYRRMLQNERIHLPGCNPWA
jgi:squalene-hopene/tetraprenyl-beta-curcumene cyclase